MRVIAGSSTQSRARRPVPDGWHPVVMARGGCWEEWLVQTPTEEFQHRIDVTWVMDQGGPVLGYTAPWGEFPRQLLRRVRQLTGKTGLYGPGGVVSDIELLAGQLLCETVGPFLMGGVHQQRMRWLANGSDACDCAVRLARAWTERTAVLSVGYHGSSVIFSHPPQNAGIPPQFYPLTHAIPFGEVGELERAFRFWDLAAVIVEVPPEDDDAEVFLSRTRVLCDRYGALLVLDEVVTGFRLALGGAAELYKVRPDIACYGKALSNGRGIAAVVGREEILELLSERVFYSNTYNGDPYNCAHVVATLEILRQNGDDIYGYIWEIGAMLKQGLNELGVRTVGTEARTIFKMPEAERLLLCRELVRRGILMDRPAYTSMAHSEASVQRTLDAVKAVNGTAI